MKYFFVVELLIRNNALVSTLSLYPPADNNLVLFFPVLRTTAINCYSLLCYYAKMNSNWNTLVTPVDGYDNSRNVYNDETFIHGFPLRMPDEGYDTDRDVYNAETFGHITKRKKPIEFDAPPGLDANKRFKSVNERRPSFADGRPPLHPSEARIRSIVRDEIYQAARAAVGAVRPVTLAVPIDTNPSYLTPRPSRVQREAPWAPARIPLQRSYHTDAVYGCGRTGWQIMCDNNPALLARESNANHLVDRLAYNFDSLQEDN